MSEEHTHSVRTGAAQLSAVYDDNDQGDSAPSPHHSATPTARGDGEGDGRGHGEGRDDSEEGSESGENGESAGGAGESDGEQREDRCNGAESDGDEDSDAEELDARLLMQLMLLTKPALGIAQHLCAARQQSELRAPSS